MISQRIAIPGALVWPNVASSWFVDIVSPIAGQFIPVIEMDDKIGHMQAVGPNRRIMPESERSGIGVQVPGVDLVC